MYDIGFENKHRPKRELIPNSRWLDLAKTDPVRKSDPNRPKILGFEHD